MKLYLKGHDCRYAVDQILFTLYPEERPEYCQLEPEGDGAVIAFSRGEKRATAHCALTIGGVKYEGRAHMSLSEFEGDSLSAQSHTQRLVKLAFYRAAVRQMGEKPAWGAITGIRPATLMARLLNAGLSEGAALRKYCRAYDTDRSKAELGLRAAQTGREIARSLEKKDVCLYIGIPFCPTRCAYCSFVSQSVEKSMHLIEPFLAALFQEIEKTAEVVRESDLRVISIYMGGGTPTTLSSGQLAQLIDKLRECFCLDSLREFCVEAGRPDTISREKMLVLREKGVDRVSINPQSMNNAVLQNIGRSHTAEDILKAYEIVRGVDGLAVNMDLIAGLPGDTEESFSQTLGAVLSLEPENITVHNLAHKKGSTMTPAAASQAGAKLVGKMLGETHSRMVQQGYSPYYLYRQKFTSGGFENVGWCKKGYENTYNVCIMEELCSIIALGGGASTKLVAPHGRMERIYCPKYPMQYIAGIDKVCADKNKIKEFYDAISTQ